MKNAFLPLTLFATTWAVAQNVTFSEHIAPIIYSACTNCHRNGEIGPMPFTNYQEVAAFAPTIAQVVQTGYMPPWPPDPGYRPLVGERVLTPQEKQLIVDWAAAGAPQGNPALEPALPNFPSGSVLGTPDLVLPMAQKFTTSGNGEDEYRVFVLPTGLLQDQEVAAFEFRAGNKKIVHHALMISEHSGIGQTLDNQSPGYGYTSFGGFGIPNNQIDDFHGGWAPGLVPSFFPSGTGQLLKANSNLLLQIHYAPYPLPEADSSYVNVFFRPQPIARRVENFQYAYTQLVLPANLVTKVKRSFVVPSTKSLIGFMPHAHLIGEEWKLYFRTPQGDTVPVIHIPKWDFNWQGEYKPKTMIKVPAGSVFYAECTYDNTATNPNNPNSPPRAITWGEGTEDEMFYFILQFLPYQAGDENISLESNGLGTPNRIVGQKLIKAFPNPAVNKIEMELYFKEFGKADWEILDVQGRSVSRSTESRFYFPGTHRISLDLSSLSAGNYIFVLQFNGEQLRQSFIKSNN